MSIKNLPLNFYRSHILRPINLSAWVFYAFAVVQNDIAITTAITESYPAIALLLGIWLNKEKIKAHQCIGAGLALIASILLAFVI